MAQFAFRVNETTENIGARRLHTIMERVLDEISFLAPDVARRTQDEAQAAALSESIQKEDIGAASLFERIDSFGPGKSLSDY